MFLFPTHIKIISGGQTGVDRAALDFALKYNIPCGGWCPKGRLAEDGRIPEKYPLNETTTTNCNERTEKNISDSDGTLIIHSNRIDYGTKLTMDLCSEYNKPLLVIDLNNDVLINRLINWIQIHHINIINIAGPRENNSPGIYEKTFDLLNCIFEGDEKN
jgi:hypothetical protein